MKRTDLEKLKGLKIRSDLRGTPTPDRFAGAHGEAATRREQRELDRARGLVPFAIKLEGKLVDRVRTHAEKAGLPLNDAVAALLRKGLGEDPGA